MYRKERGGTGTGKSVGTQAQGGGGSVFIVHGSRFAVDGSWFTIRSSRFTIYSLQFAVHDSQFTVHVSQFMGSIPGRDIPTSLKMLLATLRFTW